MFLFCKIDIFLLSSVLNRILLVGLVSIGSAGRWVVVGGSVSKWSVVSWLVLGRFDKTLLNNQHVSWTHVIHHAYIFFLQILKNNVTTETGISYFYKLFITVVRVFYKMQKPETTQYYRSYKNFKNQLFQTELNIELLKIDLNNVDLLEFTAIFSSVLDKPASKKRKFITSNNSNFVPKNIRKAIMER